MRFGGFSRGWWGSAAQNLRAVNDHAAREASAGLTILQLAGAFCIDPEQTERRLDFDLTRFLNANRSPLRLKTLNLHHFKTTARIALPR
jgi:hypothetical protein